MNQIKTLALLIVVGGVFACKANRSHPNFVEISGTIHNAKSKEVTLYTMGGDNKTITIQENGTFKDTFAVKSGKSDFQMLLNEDQVMTKLYAENGANIYLEVDASDFKNTIKFSNDFADYNNYQSEKYRIISSDIGFDPKIWYRFDEAEFEEHVNTLRGTLNTALHSYKTITPEQIEKENTFTERYIKNITSKYEKEHSFATKLDKGSVSPEFVDYENYDGSKTSLSDFKGKYVFIDVWATWCTPCKAQIPYLEELEKEYKDENIVFVSMSVDKPSDKEKWSKMVKDKHMSGVQILAPNATKSEFALAYNINSIPRFILIDPQGNIVDFDAPRPSNKEAIHKLLDIVKS
ncbi:TlpA family protein disulfide reductase [Aestuariibaculum sp. M13]|uniref:TlpA family protein disulfide reductase n=1 Tax=Aestuariibaculum sp. M13 TaxID=2967132 RepID=UPI00215A0927|nr:TlpA disulfide reductase family protein [Aestuariibaculum sp. M13]MCR8669018.1 TlpA family protein disulfide reductase [Aestuariibaculum sp. M13]